VASRGFGCDVAKVSHPKQIDLDLSTNGLVTHSLATKNPTKKTYLSQRKQIDLEFSTKQLVTHSLATKQRTK